MVKKFIEPYTRLIDLSLSEEEILAQMTEKGRYNVRYALKKGVIVENLSFDLSCVDEWYDRLRETAERDGFFLNPRSFFESLSGVSTDGKDVRYIRAMSASGEYLSSMIFVGYGQVGYYYYGASRSESEYRKLQSPYALQYAAMCYARESGYRYYDFLGIAPPEETHHHLA